MSDSLNSNINHFTLNASLSDHNSSMGASSSAGVHHLYEQDSFTSWDAGTNNLQGYVSQRTLNLKHNLMKKELLKGNVCGFEHYSISSRPSVRSNVSPEQRYIATGANHPDAKEYYLSIVHGHTMLTDCMKNPVSSIQVSEHIADTKWLDDTTILCATGRGNLQLFQFHSNRSIDQAITHVHDIFSVSDSYIRELAVHPSTANIIVIGGFDQKLSFLDLNRPDNPFIQRLDMQATIGSIKWSPFTMGSYVGCTLDEGKYYQFDVRQKITDAAFFLDLRKDDLFCHERFDDFNLLLGFGDGEFCHVDMRKANQCIETIQDPYVEAIGGIDWNDSSRSFVISGYTDFSVWKLGGSDPFDQLPPLDGSLNSKTEGKMMIWSHSESGRGILRSKGWSCGTAWYDSKTVVMGDCDGGLALYVHDFD